MSLSLAYETQTIAFHVHKGAVGVSFFLCLLFLSVGSGAVALLVLNGCLNVVNARYARKTAITTVFFSIAQLFLCCFLVPRTVVLYCTYMHRESDRELPAKPDLLIGLCDTF